MSTPLEQRYRRVLKLLPPYYRTAWEEDMVSAFLDSMTTGDPEMDELTADIGHPGLAELASVAALAVRLRLGGPAAPPRYFAWGQAVRRAVLIATLLQAANALPTLVIMLWQGGRIGWLPAPAPILSTAGHPDAWRLPEVLLGYAWLPAFVELLRGHPRAARAWALLASVPPAAAAVRSLNPAPPHLAPAVAWADLLLLNLLPIAAMAAFHRDAPPLPRAAWLTALLASLGVIILPLDLIEFGTLTPELGYVPGRVCVIVAFVGILQFPRALARPDHASSSWSLSLALLAGQAVLLRMITLGYPHVPGVTAVDAWEALAVAGVGVLLAADGVRALRRPMPPSAAGHDE